MSTLNVRDYGANGDGSADDTPAIQRAIDDASDGDTIYFPEPSEHYRLENSSSGEAVLVIDGDRHANNLSLVGDGQSTVIKMADGVSSTYRMLRILHPNGFSVTIRDLVFDGNKQNASNTDADGTTIEYRSSGATGTGDMVVEDVELRNSLTTGMNVQYGGVTVNRLTTHDNNGHGISVHTDWSGHHDPAPVFRNVHSYRNATMGGRYAFDFSGGKGVLEDSVLEDSVNGGGTKCSVGQIEFTYRRVRVQNNPSHSFQNTGDNEDSTIVFDDVIFENGGLNVRLNKSANYLIPDGSALLATNHEPDNRGQIHVLQNATLDASSADIYSNRMSSDEGLNSETSSQCVIGNYYHYENDGGNIKERTNLKIDNEEERDKTDLESVPTADEVGAWTDGEQVKDEPDDESTFESWTPRWASTEADWSFVTGSEYEGEHALKFEAEGTDRTRYAMSWDTVGEPSDVEILDKVRVPEFTENDSHGYHGRIYLRSSIDSGTENGYWLEIEKPSDGFRLAKYTHGGLTTLNRFGTPSENTFYYRRFRADGDTLSVKVWEATEQEPSAWDVEVTDSDHTDGWVGLGSFDTEAVETDVLSVGVDGESAPGPFSDVSHPPSVAWVAPGDGETVRGDESIAIDVSNVEDDESPTVEYRIDDGSWRDLSYESDSGTYVDDWDTTTVQDGTHTLEARVVGADTTDTDTIETTVDNGIIVESRRSEDVTETNATLVGELISLGGLDSVTCLFEWHAAGSESWNGEGTQTREATGTFEATIDDLEPDTDYEFRAVAEGSDRDTGRTVSFRTSAADETSNGLSIDQFDVTEKSNPTWTWFDIDWAVSDEDGELNTVVTELRYDETTVAAESTSISGDTASFSHDLRVQGDVDEIRLSVNDTSNETRTETKSV